MLSHILIFIFQNKNSGMQKEISTQTYTWDTRETFNDCHQANHWGLSCRPAAGEAQTCRRSERGDFRGGPVVKSAPSNALEAGPVPGWGTKVPHAVEHLSLLPQLLSPGPPEPWRHNWRVCVSQLLKWLHLWTCGTTRVHAPEQRSRVLLLRPSVAK